MAVEQQQEQPSDWVSSCAGAHRRPCAAARLLDLDRAHGVLSTDRIPATMPFLRLLLAWIMMFAIPVQGFAAASMVFCGNPTGQHQAQAGQHSHPPGTPAHAHAPAANQDPWPGAPSQDHAQHQPDATPWAGVDSAKADAGNLTDQSHVCGVCASCCHAVAITPTPLVVLPDSPMQADLGEPLMAAYSRPSLVPDKPPRA